MDLEVGMWLGRASARSCYLDDCGNSRANTCAHTQLRGRVVFIRYRTNPGYTWSFGDS